MPLTSPPVLTTRLQALLSQLARTGRDTGFFQESDQLMAGNDSGAAWAWVPDQPAAGSGYAERQEHEHRGCAVYSTGQVVAFKALPTDFIGALVDQPELQRRAARLLAVAARHLPMQAVQQRSRRRSRR